MRSFRFEIQDFDDTDVLVSNDGNAPAEQLADQIIAAWTTLILPTTEPKNPLSDTTNDNNQSDSDDDSE